MRSPEATSENSVNRKFDFGERVFEAHFGQ